jgi:hypothetical protein
MPLCSYYGLQVFGLLQTFNTMATLRGGTQQLCEAPMKPPVQFLQLGCDKIYFSGISFVCPVFPVNLFSENK